MSRPRRTDSEPEAKTATEAGAPAEKADDKPTLDRVSESLRSLRETKEAAAAAAAKGGEEPTASQPPPPVGLPDRAVPTWGRRLEPLHKPTKDDDNRDQPASSSLPVNPLARKAGMVLSPIALDFLKKRDIPLDKLPDAKGIAPKQPNRQATAAVYADAPR